MARIDVIVIGAGVFGLATAYHIKRINPGKNVVVLERFGACAQGNSARTACAFRNVFASETNFTLADSTIDFFLHVHGLTKYDLNIHMIGYLWLLDEKRYHDQRSLFDSMERRGVQLQTYDAEELRRNMPGLCTEFTETDEEARAMGMSPIRYGIKGVKCGTLDVDRLARYYETAFIQSGGRMSYNTEVTKLVLKPEVELGLPDEPLVWQDAAVKGVETRDGHRIDADTTIISAGAWASRLLNPIGLDAFMNPKKRQIFVFKDSKLGNLFHSQGFNEERVAPFTILPKGGLYIKPELSEGTIWLGCADNLGRAYLLEDDPQAEPDYYAGNLYYPLAKYFPCFTNLKPVNMWAGSYAINSLDKIPIVLKEPGMIYVGADSGSGLMKCDAIGRIAAALYSDLEQAQLFGGKEFRSNSLTIRDRRIEKETLVI